MKHPSRGFTLIELLVVVLIIGILAAIAVPQYQKAVMKSRIVQVLPVIRALADAQQVYYYANGTYAETLEELGMSFPCPDGWTCVMGVDGSNNNKKADKVEAYRSDTNTLGVIYYYGGTTASIFSRKLYCWAKTTDKQAVDICKSFGPKLLTSDGFTRYLIQ